MEIKRVWWTREKWRQTSNQGRLLSIDVVWSDCWYFWRQIKRNKKMENMNNRKKIHEKWIDVNRVFLFFFPFFWNERESEMFQRWGDGHFGKCLLEDDIRTITNHVQLTCNTMTPKYCTIYTAVMFPLCGRIDMCFARMETESWSVRETGAGKHTLT